MSAVLKPWVQELPWKQQSTIISGLKGPDSALCPNLKALTRWMRIVCQENADPEHTYMQDTSIDDEVLWFELEYTSLHYAMHLIHALQVITYGGMTVRNNIGNAMTKKAQWYYITLVRRLHLTPETREEFAERLKDKRSME